MSKEKPSLQDILKKRQQGDFVGRENQLALFADNLKLGVEDEKRRFVFNVWGQGGVGKSTLLRQFHRLAGEAGAAMAYVSETEGDVPAVMGRMAEQLKEQGQELKSFAERYKVWRQKREELESDPDVPQGIAAFIGRSLMKGAIRAGRRVPVGGMALDFIDEDALVDQASEWAEFVRRRLTNKDEVHLVLEPVAVLTPLFVEGLRKIGEKCSLALFFDTYEQRGVFVGSWLREVLNGRYGEMPADIVVVIAGRDELDRNQWVDFQGFLARLPLDPFSEEEARNFLARKGVTHPDVVKVILELSGRLPLLVATLAVESPTDPDQVGDASGTAVDRFLKWIEDPCQRQIALDAALGRTLNHDIIEQLVTEDCGRSADLFGWLKAMPFVNETAGGWVYHEVVRTQMLRYQRRESPKRWKRVHDRLAIYYEQQRDALGLTGKKAYISPAWQKSSYSWLYHRLCQSSELNLALALNTLIEPLAKLEDDFFNRSFRLFDEASQDSENQELKVWARCFKEFEQESTAEEAVVDHFLKISGMMLNVSGLSATAQSLAFVFRSIPKAMMNKFAPALVDIKQAIEIDEENTLAIMLWASINGKLKNYEVALADYDRAIGAIELDEKFAWAIASRGQTHRLMGNYEAALADFDRAIELDEQDAGAIAGRGLTHRLMGNYEAALANYDRAIELDEQDAGAITGRGQTHRLMGNYEAALADFDRAIELDEKDAWAIASRGHTHRLMGNYEAALADFDRAIELDEKDAWAIASRGLTHRLMGNYEAALADFDQAIALDEVWPLGSRGVTHRLIGNYEAALADFDRVNDLDESHWWRYQCALVYLVQGQVEAAASNLQRAIALAEPEYQKNPQDWRNTFNLAVYHLAAGHTAEANRLDREGVNAPPHSIRDAIDDLEDFLTVRPGHEQATAMRDFLQQLLDERVAGDEGEAKE
jgi:tetratricopeptide (TPR) repeat protein